MKLKVKTYSGFKADEKPISFIKDGIEYEVAEIVDAWVGVKYDYWRVKVESGERYILKVNREKDVWEIENS